MKNDEYYLCSIKNHLINLKTISEDTEIIMSIPYLSLCDNINWLENYIEQIENKI